MQHSLMYADVFFFIHLTSNILHLSNQFKKILQENFVKPVKIHLADWQFHLPWGHQAEEYVEPCTKLLLLL